MEAVLLHHAGSYKRSFRISATIRVSGLADGVRNNRSGSEHENQEVGGDDGEDKHKIFAQKGWGAGNGWRRPELIW